MSELDLFQQFGVGQTKSDYSDDKRCILYTRVSTKGQEDGMSLEVQAETCRRVADRYGYQIVAEFGNKGESANTGAARKAFDDMLKFAMKKTNRIRYWYVVNCEVV